MPKQNFTLSSATYCSKQLILEENHRRIDRAAEKTYPRFLDLYNPMEHKPVGEYQGKIDAVKRDLREMGLDVL